jgi:glycosyltransferase involved in cell wall biosynthesis
MGGDTRHFATLAADLSASDAFRVKVINTSRGLQHSNPLRNALVALRVLLRVALALPKVDVLSYHASDRGMLLFGPLLHLLARLAGKPILLRLFGGSFGDYFGSRGALGRLIIRKGVLSADVVLLQTRRLIGQLEQHGTARLVWFSTYVRSVSPPPAQDKVEPEGERICRRFVYLGHLWRTKGLETLLESAPQLPQHCHIDIFGPPDEYSGELINARGAGRVRYGGFLTHEQVDRKLWEYDCLVLPTFHPGEGYPGVIAEAFAHALPVITTRWMAIPEMVDESCGMLVEPGDTPAFVAAIARLHADPAQWRRLKLGAQQRAGDFDHAQWATRFEELCAALVRL